MAGNITAANAVYMLSVGSVFTTPVQLQGFSADDIFDTDAIDTAELLMGVDGLLSGGFIFVPIKQKIVLQADSESNDLFDQWFTAQQAAQQLFTASGYISLTSIGKNFAMTRGFLSSYKPTPAAKKVLQPRSFEITWNSISPAPS